MFPFSNLINRRVLAGIVASVLTISVVLIAKSNLPTVARSKVYNSEGISQKWRSSTKQKPRYYYRTPANKPTNQVAQIDNNRRRIRIVNNSTPVTNQFGVTGRRPSSALWQAEIKRRYGIGNYPTPVTNRFNRFSSSGGKFASERWRTAIKRTYDIESSPTPVTDRFGATGSRPSSELWRAEIKRRYGIGNAVREPVDEPR